MCASRTPVSRVATELADVFESMERLRLEFESLARPSGLPAPGEPLPCAEEPPEALAAHLQQVRIDAPAKGDGAMRVKVR